jgi:hypothetical protein
LPKSHERRIHGHRHAGIRLVLEGPTLVHALDAHAAHPGPFTVDDLLPYRAAREPPCQPIGIYTARWSGMSGGSLLGRTDCASRSKSSRS